MASSFWNGEFYFDSIHSSKYKVCIIDFNSSDIVKQIGGNFSISTEKDNSYRNNLLYRETECMSENITLQLCKTDKQPWNIADILNINGWLFQENFKKFQPTDFDNQGYNIIYYLKAIDMKKFFNTNMEGYIEVTFQSYDGFAYIVPNINMVINGNETRTVVNQSNINKKYYPKIKITNWGDSKNEITITNLTTGDELVISGMENNEVITIDCAIGSVVNTSGVNRFEVLQNFNFIGLAKGNNTITLSPNCSASFICEFPIIL